MYLGVIRRKCEEFNITFAELEKRIEIGNGVIAKWENAKNGPTVGILQKVADYFHCTVDDLLKEEGHGGKS